MPGPYLEHLLLAIHTSVGELGEAIECAARTRAERAPEQHVRAAVTCARHAARWKRDQRRVADGAVTA